MSNESTVHGETRFGPTTFETRRDEPFRRCSYCGSIHPEDLVALRDAGQLARVDRSVDWKYGWPHKIYVDVVNPEPDVLHVVSAITFEPREGEEGWLPAADYREELERDGWLSDRGYTYVRLGKRPTTHAKFYNVHQAEPWVTDELRLAVGSIAGYVITDAGDGKIRWRAFDYSADAG